MYIINQLIVNNMGVLLEIPVRYWIKILHKMKITPKEDINKEDNFFYEILLRA